MPTIFKHTVISNGITFNDAGAQPVGAQSWGVDVMEGWLSSPEVTVYSTERGGEVDGDADGAFFPIRSRFVTVEGFVLAASQDEAHELHTLLLRDAFPRNTLFQVTRYEPVPKFIRARRASEVITEWPMENGFRWQTTLKASDPFKYAIASEEASAGVAGISTGGMTFPITFPLVFVSDVGDGDTSANILNRGNAHSPYITATITGPLVRGGWRLRNDTTGGEMFFDVGLGSTDVLTIDFLSETAFLNSYPISSSLSGSFWELAPGPNAIRLYADYDPSTTLTIVAKSAWE